MSWVRTGTGTELRGTCTQFMALRREEDSSYWELGRYCIFTVLYCTTHDCTVCTGTYNVLYNEHLLQESQYRSYHY